jgi:N-acetylglucosaminyl-diphospho-decaprenol L-rhamnosyltransferase
LSWVFLRRIRGTARVTFSIPFSTGVALSRLECRIGANGAVLNRSQAVGIVVLAYGAGPDDFDCIDRLLADGIDPRRIVVVHNPDGTGRVPRVPVSIAMVYRQVNGGYALGMNQGIKYWLDRGAEWVLILTHDAGPEPGAVQALLEAGYSCSGYGALGPRLISRGERASHSDGGIVRAPGVLAHRAPERDECQEALSVSAQVHTRDWLDGSVLLLASAALRQVGCFDERFFMYVEDVDLCLRMRRAGWDVGIVKEALAVTTPGDGSRRAAYEYLYTRNALEMVRKNEGILALAVALGFRLRHAWRIIPKPGGQRFRERGAFRIGLRSALGCLAGVLGFVLRRWGPPPPRLRRCGDIGGVS